MRSDTWCSVISIAGLLVCIVFSLNGAKAAESCNESAQSYQSRYEVSGRIQDLVCMKTALVRELQGGRQQAPKVAEAAVEKQLDRIYSRTETFCLDDRKYDSLTACILAQERGRRWIEAYAHEKKAEDVTRAFSTCTGFVTGGRSLGSSENVDQRDVASCLNTPGAKSFFDSCVSSVTG